MNMSLTVCLLPISSMQLIDGFELNIKAVQVFVPLFLCCCSRGKLDFVGRFEVLLCDNVLVLLTKTPSVHTVGKEGCPSIWMRVKILKKISPAYSLEGC